MARVSFVGPHNRCHYTGQKVQLCVFPLLGQGNSETLVGLLKLLDGYGFPMMARSLVW